jgi:hypothetical protein
MWFYIFLFWSTHFNYSLYIVEFVECMRTDSRSPFERPVPLWALLCCPPVRSLYITHPLQEQAVFRIITKIIMMLRGKSLLFVPVTLCNMLALNTAPSIGLLLPIYRGADNSLALPGRKQATSMSKSSRMIDSNRSREMPSCSATDLVEFRWSSKISS